jgi:hypothetical protein
MILSGLKPDHWLFCFVDGLVYTLAFALLVVTLRQSLRWLAKHEADATTGKSFVSTLLILLIAASTSTLPYVRQIGTLVLLPAAICGIFLLKILCWVSLKRGVLIMGVFAAAAWGLVTGVAALEDKILPPNRITLVKRIKISMGILDELASLPTSHMSLKDQLATAKSGLRLELEAVASALSLLKDPDAVKGMTAGHTADLDALGLVVNHEAPPTPEQLASMGIVYEKAKPGLDVLRGMTATNAVTADDVRNVAALLKSLRKDGSEVTAKDAVALILEAQKRAGELRGQKPSAMPTNAFPATSPELPALSSITTTAAQAVGPIVATVTHPSSNPAGAEATMDTRLIHNTDPFSAVTATNRSAWQASRSHLVVTALMRHGNGETLAMVNGELVRLGNIVQVKSAGRTFSWRMAGTSSNNVIWEPVFGAVNTNDANWIQWR